MFFTFICSVPAINILAFCFKRKCRTKLQVIAFNNDKYYKQSVISFLSKAQFQNNQNNYHNNLEKQTGRPLNFNLHQHTLIFASSGPLLESATLVPCFSLCLYVFMTPHKKALLFCKRYNLQFQRHDKLESHFTLN